MSALIEAARDLAEAVESMQATFGCIQGKTPEDDDLHIHEKWAEEFLAERLAGVRTALAAAEAQPVGEPFGYVITNNVPESSPYRHVFYRPSEISAAYKDNALYSTPVYTAPPEWLSRFHHLMKKHGLHPGRTDDDLLDILDAHLSAAPPAQPAAQPLTDEQISALVLATVYEGDSSTAHRDAWAAEIGVPFARAIERAHGIGSKP